MASSSSAELTRSYSTTRGGILNSTRARPGLRPIALSTPANGSLRMPNPAKDQKREEKVLAKLPEICLGLPQAREVKTWRPTCRRSRVTKRRGAKARRQCRQGLRLPGKNSFRRKIRGWLRYPGGGGPISWWRPNQHESSQGIQGLRHERYGFETRRPGYGIQRYACRRSHYRFRNSERQRQ